jgi:flagellar basal body-associated protein FliL
MKKRSWLLIIIIILVAVLLIVTVIWIYSKKIENIESRMKVPAVSQNEKSNRK